MKKMKLFVAALCCMCAALMFNSCGENVTMQAAYGIGIHKEAASGDDFYNFCLYLREKGVVFEGNESTLIYKGKSQADCDAQAVKFFNEQVAKISYEEVEAFLQFPDDFYIEYSIVAAKKSESEETRVLGAWYYPKK